MNREVHVRFWESAGLRCSALLTHLKAYANGLEARISIGQWVRFYNERRLHQTLGYKTPAAVWAAEVSPVDLPLRLDDAGASPTTPQGQQQQNVINL